MTATQRLALKFIQPGQAQKELFHNEALQTLDIVVAAAVEEPPLDTPPASPLIGTCFIVGSAPTGDWASFAGHLAAFTAGGWRFVAPLAGMTAHIQSTQTTAAYRSSAWEIGVLRADSLVVAGEQVVGARGAAIADPAGGTTVDAEARSAIGAILAAFRQHGLIGS